MSVLDAAVLAITTLRESALEWQAEKKAMKAELFQMSQMLAQRSALGDGGGRPEWRISSVAVNTPTLCASAEVALRQIQQQHQQQQTPVTIASREAELKPTAVRLPVHMCLQPSDRRWFSEQKSTGAPLTQRSMTVLTAHEPPGLVGNERFCYGCAADIRSISSTDSQLESNLQYPLAQTPISLSLQTPTRPHECETQYHSCLSVQPSSIAEVTGLGELQLVPTKEESRLEESGEKEESSSFWPPSQAAASVPVDWSPFMSDDAVPSHCSMEDRLS